MNKLPFLILALLLASCEKTPIAVDCRGNEANPIAHCDVTTSGKIVNCGCISIAERDRALPK